MATITLKGNKEPIITDRSVAQKIKDWWFDENIPMTAKTDIGEVSCLKGEIKQINLSAMGVLRKKEDHWIIISYKKNSIWQGTFPTYETAKEEYDRQMDMLHPEIRQEQDWVIEKRSADIIEEEPKDVKDDNWGGF